MKIILVALAGSEKAWKNGAEGRVCFEVKTIKKNTNALKAPNYCLQANQITCLTTYRSLTYFSRCTG